MKVQKKPKLRKNKKDILAKAVEALKKGEDPTLQVTKELKKLKKKKP